MSAGYVPQIGDRIRHAGWADPDAPPNSRKWADVLAVDGGSMWVRYDSGDSGICFLEGDWIRVGPVVPLPESWINVYSTGGYDAHDTLEGAMEWSNEGIVARVRIWTDADGVDRIERVPL